MESQAKETADVYDLVKWAHAHRKPLIQALVAVVVLGTAIWFYFWNKDRHETAASEAVSNLKLPGSSTNTPSPDPFITVAQDYAGTSGGARAMLIAAGILFEKGDFTRAQAKFEQFQQT